MLIGELAGELGVNPRTIRFYERIGLLPAADRTDAGYRVYGSADAERLRFVKSAQRLGLTLDEIKEILAFAERDESPCGYVRDVLGQQVAAIDARIRELHRLRDRLAALNTRAAELPPPADGCYCPIIHVAQDEAAAPPESGSGRRDRPRRRR